MKKIIAQFLTPAICLSLLLTACSKDFITKNPNDSIPLDQALSDEVGVTNALNGAYAQLRSVSLWGRDLPVIGDLQADNTFLEVRNSGRYQTQYNYNLLNSDGVAEEIWSAAYTGILRCNQIIAASASGGNVPQIKAQAYAIRGLLYFKLINIYARPFTDNPEALGVPLVLTYEPTKLPTRNKVSEVYTQIISDLKTAFTDGPDYVNSIRLSKYAIEGLLANAYLYMGDFANAQAAAIDVIKNSNFNLVAPADFDTYWSNPAIQSDKVETMFEIDADAINNNGFDDLGGIYNNGYQDLYASQQLVDLYSATDVRASVLIAGTTKGGAPATIVNKFPNATSSDRDNLKVLRLSEVYLIAAEASLPGDEAGARTYLNNLVAQRDPSFAGYSSTGAQLLADIVQERRKELAFEGNRLYDLNRLKLPILRFANPGAVPAGQNNVNLSVPYSDYRRIYPIPLSEIQANPNIADEQNPGY
jgi:starch-binding outer membrane protein, SusD/RagB family